MTRVGDSLAAGDLARVRTKVCGITRAADLATAVGAGADAVGVVAAVDVDTPREVTLDRAPDLLARVPPFVAGVLVTMPDSVSEALAHLERTGADAIQVHGQSADTVGDLAAAVDVPVLAAVDSTADVEAYGGVVDALLLDSIDEQGGGGTGETHDWDRAAGLVDDLDVPVVLAGGLTPANVAEAVDRVRPFGVDVATGVERRGGVKDPDAVRSFVARATGRAEVRQ